MTANKAKLLDGKWLASLVEEEIKGKVEELSRDFGRRPGLGVILVGDNPASKVYVANKEKFAKRCGLETMDRKLPANAKYDDVRDVIHEFNHTAAVDGILLQLPLPKHLKSSELIDHIDPMKDADGLHPKNQGLMMRCDGLLKPCTPLGVMELIDLAYSPIVPGNKTATLADIAPVDLSGKVAVVVGRSILVGKPVSMLLQERNATVIMAHSKTKDLPALARTADVLVAAVGSPNMVKGDWIKEGAIVIDVGINRLPDGTLTGDVDFAAASERCAAITPVPGGCGPMTIAMLVFNTLQSFIKKNSR